MRDDLLKEHLMGYARTAAEQASQPGAAAIRRRARRRVQRLAALTIAGAVAAGGIALGIGLRHTAVPVVNQPRPPATVTPAAKPPGSFVTVIPGGAGADSATWRSSRPPPARWSAPWPRLTARPSR